MHCRYSSLSDDAEGSVSFDLLGSDIIAISCDCWGSDISALPVGLRGTVRDVMDLEDGGKGR